MSCAAKTFREPASKLTNHARVRMAQRRITPDDIAIVLQYGRVFYAKGAVIHIVGRLEAERFLHVIDLSHLDGVHVVCSLSAAVLTVYRDRQFHTKSLRDVRRFRGSRWA